ncbi:MAG: hypothetical protein GZ085_05675 [Sulfuriferula multivorans]|uniref:Uncharacterized protein n=1 Tax=Sulfuriferula multivorans TaxID=1559896 RepID=A0A7C9K911_9PROT|nr:hypothetical protein [Sulfuriferula multivorans]
MPNHKRQTIHISGTLRSRINSLAHAQAQQAETRYRSDMLRHLQDAAGEGASLDDLHAMVDVMEAGANEYRSVG